MHTHTSERKIVNFSFAIHSSFFTNFILMSGNSSSKSVSKGTLKKIKNTLQKYHIIW